MRTSALLLLATIAQAASAHTGDGSAHFHTELVIAAAVVLAATLGIALRARLSKSRNR